MRWPVRSARRSDFSRRPASGRRRAPCALGPRHETSIRRSRQRWRDSRSDAEAARARLQATELPSLLPPARSRVMSSRRDLQELRRLGYEPVYDDSVFARRAYVAGDAAVRAAAFQQSVGGRIGARPDRRSWRLRERTAAAVVRFRRRCGARPRRSSATATTRRSSRGSPRDAAWCRFTVPCWRDAWHAAKRRTIGRRSSGC